MDPVIETSADLLKELNEIKTGLETQMEQKASTIANVAVDAKATELQSKIDEVNAKIDQVKGLNGDVTVADLKTMKDDLATSMKAISMLSIEMKNPKVIAPEKVKTFDERILEAVNDAHDNIEKFKRKEIKKFAMEIKAVGTVSTGNLTGTTVWGSQVRGGLIMNPDRMTHVRDLLPVTNVGPGTDYYFMRENGTGEGSIAAVAEATGSPTNVATGLKPQFDLDLVEASVKFEYIAGWMLMTRKAMNNIPGFAAFLQRRLPQKLMNAEDAYILYGTGSTPEIKGILTSGNYTASTSSSDPLIERIIDDISLLEDTYERQATGIALRPVDYYSFFKNKASGSDEYNLPQGVFLSNGGLTILGIPVSRTTALHTNDYVVGDFQNGAELLIQEAMRLEFFEQDDINVRTNRVTVRIEESAALPVYSNNYFIRGDSTPVTS